MTSAEISPALREWREGRASSFAGGRGAVARGGEARKPGRPTKRSAPVTRMIVAALRAGNTRSTSAKLAGIDYATLKRWCQLSAPFCAALEKAEAEAERKYVRNITSAAADGNWQAAAWWLERRRSGDWRKPADRLDVFDASAEARRIVGLHPEITYESALAEVERVLAEARA